MRKVSILCLTFLTMGVLTGCQKFSPDGTAVIIKSNGKVVSEVQETFDKDYYDEAELKSSIESAISEYNTSQGTENVKEKGFRVKDQMATLEMEYATGEDYAKFNQVSFFVGDVLSAYYDAGYDFQTTFQSVDKGTVISSQVTREEVLNSYNYDTLILEEPIEVKVPGTIVYASENVAITGKNTAKVIGSDEEESEAQTETVTETETKEAGVLELEPVEIEGTSEEEGTQLAYILYK